MSESKLNTNNIVKKRYTDPKTGKFAEGNPGGGRPPGTFSLVTLLKNELQKCPEGQDKRTYADLLIQRIMKSAIQEGNDQQIKNILQYVEGMPKGSLDLTTLGKELPTPIYGGISVLQGHDSDQKDLQPEEKN